MKLRAHWKGRLPEVGDVLRSPGPRARCAYVIVGVTIVQRMMASYLEIENNAVRVNGHREEARCVFEVERVGLDELPTGAKVHAWTWDKRDRRAA